MISLELQPAQILERWAPTASPWSPWAKPVLFAQLEELPSTEIQPALDRAQPDVGWAPAAEPELTLVIELPGEQAAWTGLALAQRGFRPVPLFNGCHGPEEIVDTQPLMIALAAGATRLTAVELRPEAPPAFLLDARRLAPDRPSGPGMFDNRWRVFPQDFPSANFLHSRGVRRVLLVQQESLTPMDDLAHVLLRWQEGGLEIQALGLSQPGTPATAIQVARPGGFRSLWYTIKALAGLERNAAGGFGSRIPVPSQGSGGFHGGFS